MKYKKKTILGITLPVLILVSVFTFTSFSGHFKGNKRGVHAEDGSFAETDGGFPDDTPGDSENAMESDRTMDREGFIARLRELYGAGIHHPRVQLEAIEALIRYLKKTHPDAWETQVRDYITASFPENARELFENYRKLAAYRTWVKDNYAMLTDLPREQLDDLMMEKRKEFFGNEAMKIWELELKQKEVNEVLAEIRDESRLPFEKKTDYYRKQLEAIYGDVSEAYIKAHQQKLMNQFLDVETVQDDLHNMSKTEREEQLSALRKTMGLDHDAIQRWNRLDDERDRRWNDGLTYMKAREQVLRKSTGENQERMLDRLRQEHFGAGAETIRREEISGFYRFNRNRVYGKN